MTPMTPPVLFIIFNRPDLAAKVFERIRRARPERLYIASDGPRSERPGEAEMVAQTRQLAQAVDWPCSVRTLFREHNLGSKRAVSEAISWLFASETEGIILEHDCLPHATFFPYCATLLERYRHDPRIGHIAGSAPAPFPPGNDLSYRFSQIVHIWGFATWRRVWANYDVNFPFWNDCPADRRSLFHNLWEEIYWSSFIPDTLHERHGIVTWDTQYYFTLRLQHQLALYPSVNMVENIGLGDPAATHTSGRKALRLWRPAAAMPFPLRHPRYLLPDRRLSHLSRRFSYHRLSRYLPLLFRRLLLRLLRLLGLLRRRRASA